MKYYIDTTIGVAMKMPDTKQICLPEVSPYEYNQLLSGLKHYGKQVRKTDNGTEIVVTFSVT